MGAGGIFLRKLRAMALEEPTGFAWVEKGSLAASGYPASRSQVKWIVSQGIGSILTLTPQPLPVETVEGLGLDLGHVPMEDHREPSKAALDASVSYIEKEVADGKAVLVHCIAGEGRTGCVMAAYTMKKHGLTAPEALASIRRVKPAFVEYAQEPAILGYVPAQL